MVRISETGSSHASGIDKTRAAGAHDCNDRVISHELFSSRCNMYRVRYWKTNGYPQTWNFKCAYCPLKFDTSFCLKLHENLHQSLEDPVDQQRKRFSCHCCGKQFLELANFVFHKTLHEQPRRRKCSSKSKETDHSDGSPTTLQVRVTNSYNEITVDIRAEEPKAGDGKRQGSNELVDTFAVKQEDQVYHIDTHYMDPEASPTYNSITVVPKVVSKLTLPSNGNKQEPDVSTYEVEVKEEEEEPIYLIQGDAQPAISFNFDFGEDNTQDKASLKCSRCHETFAGAESLKMHTRLCAKQHICSFCGKVLSSNQILREHEMKHRGQCPYLCDICGSAFGRQDTLRKHKRIHLGIKKYVCDECGKVFTESGSLGKHKRIHTGSKPFVCQVCGRGFVQSGQLATHKRTHTGEKPFPCTRCNYRFTTQSSLSRHMRAHEGIKRFKCPLCKGMTFLTKEGLENHFIMHNEESLYTCAYCQRTFAREQNLTKHIKLHESKTTKTISSRMYCRVCEKSFSDEASLRRHFRRCHQIRPYACGQCGKKFADELALGRHQNTHAT